MSYGGERSLVGVSSVLSAHAGPTVHCALCPCALCSYWLHHCAHLPSAGWVCWPFRVICATPPVLTIFVPPICQCPSTTDVPIYINATSSEAFNLAIFNSRSDPSPHIDLQSSCDALRAIVADQIAHCKIATMGSR